MFQIYNCQTLQGQTSNIIMQVTTEKPQMAHNSSKASQFYFFFKQALHFQQNYRKNKISTIGKQVQFWK